MISSETHISFIKHEIQINVRLIRVEWAIDMAYIRGTGCTSE